MVIRLVCSKIPIVRFALQFQPSSYADIQYNHKV